MEPSKYEQLVGHISQSALDVASMLREAKSSALADILLELMHQARHASDPSLALMMADIVESEISRRQEN